MPKASTPCVMLAELELCLTLPALRFPSLDFCAYDAWRESNSLRTTIHLFWWICHIMMRHHYSSHRHIYTTATVIFVCSANCRLYAAQMKHIHFESKKSNEKLLPNSIEIFFDQHRRVGIGVPSSSLSTHRYIQTSSTVDLPRIH